MPVVEVTATVMATRGGTLNWAVIVTGQPPNTKVDTLIGSDSSKSANVKTEANGILTFSVELNAFPGTAWNFTLTKKGEAKPHYQTFLEEGLTDHKGRGRDGGTVTFA